MTIDKCKLRIAKWRRFRLPASAPRPAYTLTEVLVVIIIMVVMIATFLPIAKRILDNDRVRECSRQLSSYMALAKTRAVQTGRPCGLMMVLDTPIGAGAGGPPYLRQCTRLFLAEVPPLYAGSTQGARGRIRTSFTATTPWPDDGTTVYQFYPLYLNPNPTPPGPPQYEPDTTELAYLYTLIEPGEPFLIRFNQKGPWYICQRGKTGNTYPLNDPSRLVYMKQTILGTNTPVAPGYADTSPPDAPGNPGYYYQIMRSPRPVGNPLELTGGTCIDMTYSGMGPEGNQFILANSSVAVMFGTTGGVTGVYGDGTLIPPTGTLHFLLGRVNKMNDPIGVSPTHGRLEFDPEQSNLADATSLWLSVGRSTGTVSTGENLPPGLTNRSPPSMTYVYTDENNQSRTVIYDTNNMNHLAAYLGVCRQVAIGRQQMGGQ